MGLLYRINSVVTRNLPVRMARSRLRAPVASISFDDFPKSAWSIGGPVLQRYGARATYYPAGCYCGQTVDGIEYYDGDDLQALHAAGHEVGCHSFEHRYAPRTSSAQLIAEADRNAALMRQHLGDVRLSTYAFPYGASSPRTKILFSRRFAASRGIRPGVNAGMIDLAHLKAVAVVEPQWSPEMIDQVIAQAVAAPGWVIFFTHDVSDRPTPFGCTPAMLDHVLDRLVRAGVEILPIKHAMARAVFGT